MSKLDIKTEKILLLALAKMWTEQSTYIQGELKQQVKFRFSVAQNGIDSFINEIESKMSDELKEDLQAITDCLHEGMTGLRKDLLDKQLKETV